ncbi:AAA family ATPase [Cyanobium sp. FGCU-52]|nr:AAA family ATPase [Cyanobium sp. FGCU52]
MTAEAKAPFIKRIEPTNFLSFGSDNTGIDLLPLNVLIGPNGSGKSNLIEAVSLLRAAPRDRGHDLRDVTLKGGGVEEWIWKGSPQGVAQIDWLVNDPKAPKPLRHALVFHALGQGFALKDERVEYSEPQPGQQTPYFFYRYQEGRPVVNVRDQGQRQLAHDSIEPDRSILAQRRDPDSYPELAWLASHYERIRIYREWEFGRNATFRAPQRADQPNDVLAEDFSNLGLFLNRLKTRHPTAARAILDGLTDLYDGLTEFTVLVEGGTVQVFFMEGEFAIPATRLSDGTLRYLCLLAILCESNPPPLVCIEEPELGLHPDVLPRLADHLLAASQRTQLIVTTHSDILVDALSEQPESVVVCEKHHGATSMTRLATDELQAWLEKYRLGELWISGELGGTRW